jgi:Peptidase family S41/N-terminal domain of Peptidase_S41 in eukaryotic IRBP
MKGKRLLVTVLVCAAACKESAPMPIARPTVESVETPAVTQLAAWLTAFNSGDRATLLGYHQHAFAYEVASHDVADIDRELGLSQGTGGFDLKKSETPAPTSVVAIVKERHSEQFAQVKMEVAAVEPHRVTRFEIHPIPTPDEFLPPKPPRPAPIDPAWATTSPAARQFAAWLTAFNAGNRAGLIAYHQQSFPYEVASNDVAGIDHEFGLSQGTGGFDVRKPETPTPTSIVVTMQEKRSEQYARAAMEVDAAEPHRVTRFEIHPIPTPDEFLTPDERKARLVDDARRRAVIDGIAKELQAHYVFPDVANRMIAAVRDRLVHGDYDKIMQGDEFAEALTKDLRDVSHDLHLGVMFGHPPQRRGGAPEDMHAVLRAMNYGFGAIERMPGNVAHVVIDGFPPIPDDARDGIANLMSQVADADALIVDLRHNHGGSPETVALVASYLFDTPTHINDMYDRDTGAITASWTLGDVKGARFGGKKPMYVLTSKETFSGGEELAYDLQALRRAKTVGETTGGGAHPVGAHSIDASFTIRVPSGRPINPVTKTDWEGVGVKPDIPVAADAALDEAHRRAVDDIAKHKRHP